MSAHNHKKTNAQRDHSAADMVFSANLLAATAENTASNGRRKARIHPYRRRSCFAFKRPILGVSTVVWSSPPHDILCRLGVVGDVFLGVSI